MRTAGITAAAAATTAFLFLAKERDPRFYLAALPAAWLFFRLTVRSSCPAVWLLGKLGFKAPACPAGRDR